MFALDLKVVEEVHCACMDPDEVLSRRWLEIQQRDHCQLIWRLHELGELNCLHLDGMGAASGVEWSKSRPGGVRVLMAFALVATALVTIAFVAIVSVMRPINRGAASLFIAAEVLLICGGSDIYSCLGKVMES